MRSTAIISGTWIYSFQYLGYSSCYRFHTSERKIPPYLGSILISNSNWYNLQVKYLFSFLENVICAETNLGRLIRAFSSREGIKWKRKSAGNLKIRSWDGNLTNPSVSIDGKSMALPLFHSLHLFFLETNKN